MHAMMVVYMPHMRCLFLLLLLLLLLRPWGLRFRKPLTCMPGTLHGCGCAVEQQALSNVVLHAAAV
jgi:hypothetical protein